MSVDNQDLFETLSAREGEIVNLICKGYTSKEIAHLLHISHYTVISHKKNLKIKVGAKNTVEMIYKIISLYKLKI